VEHVLRPLILMLKSFKTALFSVSAKLEADSRFDIALGAVHQYAEDVINDPSLSTATDPGSSLRAARFDAGAA
jgi:uncharacterized protein (DUF1778 family)